MTINVRVAGERPKWTFTGTAGQNVYVQWSKRLPVTRRGCSAGRDGDGHAQRSVQAEMPPRGLILRMDSLVSGRPRADKVECLRSSTVPPRRCIFARIQGKWIAVPIQQEKQVKS